MRELAAAGGIILFLAAISSVLRTLVVPRGVSSLLARGILTAARAPFTGAARLLRSYRARDRLLLWSAPAGLLALLWSWLGLLIVGYALMDYGFRAERGASTAFREAGSSLLTLGFATRGHPADTALDFAAAATGPVIIALLIGYLPTLYATYSRRESEVTLLQSRAGDPAWGPELLARHQLVTSLDALPQLYADWERWAADLSESHTTYPMLVHFRSPQPLRSWVTSMLAVLDSAALYLAMAPGRAPVEARMCLRMGFVALRDIASVEGIRYDPDPMPGTPITLPYGDFVDAYGGLVALGFPAERPVAEAWEHFRGWRVNYESVAFALARRVDAVPALWSGSRRFAGEPMPPDRPVHRAPERPQG